MDEDTFSDLCIINAKKSCSKPFRNLLRTTPNTNNAQKIFNVAEKAYEVGQPLTTKIAVEYLLNGKLKSAVCRYCLNITPGLSELDQVMQIAGTGSLYKVTIRQMIACFYPFKANQDENFPEKICQKCLDKAISAYLFTQQCEQAERALLFFFDDMHEKLEKLDPIPTLDGPKKRGRQKLNPNYNVLYAEHKKVMDYAEPIRNIINVEAEPLTKEPDWNEFECKKCWQVFTNIESLLNHEKIHPKYMWYNCRLCGKSFLKLNQLKKHYNRVHVQGKCPQLEVDNSFKCKECGHVTENYMQHLQHIEKHKFKSIMKHLIEKKTDKLCMVCLNKSTDLVELDKMVCIHGGYPELMGDKTLYSVLASTLPDQKSYKYQELHIPHKARIMSISKRKRNSSNVQNVPKITFSNDLNRELNFTLSSPTIVSKDIFKTNDFYYFVFCKPQKETNAIMIDNNISILDSGGPKILDVTNEPVDIDNKNSVYGKELMDVTETSNSGVIIQIYDKDPVNYIENSNPEIKMVSNAEPNNIFALRDDKAPTDLNKHSNITDKILIDGKESINLIGICNPVEKIVPGNEEAIDLIENCNVEDDIVIAEEHLTDVIQKDKYDDINKKPPFTMEKLNIPEFSNPVLIKIDNYTSKNDDTSTAQNKNKVEDDITWTFNFSNPDYHIKPREEIIISNDNIPLVKNRTNQTWIFSGIPKNDYTVEYNMSNKDTENVNNIIVTPLSKKLDCKLCWIFKHYNKCEYCKKSIDHPVNFTDKDRQNIEMDNFTEISTAKYHKYDKTSEQLTHTEIDTKEHKIKKTWQCNICLSNNTIDRFICSCCESKKYIENGNVKITFGNKNTLFETTQSKEHYDKKYCVPNIRTLPSVVFEEASMMDFKSVNEQENGEIQMANIKEIGIMQSMDVEIDSSFNNLLDTKATLKSDEEMDVEENLPIPNISNIHHFIPTPATNILPNINNFQFNMGTTAIGKGSRKPKRPLRNIPKAFHK